MAGNKSIEDRTRKIYNQRIEPGKEFEQMQSAQNQLMQIQSARQQNLRENQIESENLAAQNQLLAQAAQVGMMSNGAGSMQVNPATQGVMGRFGLVQPMTTSSQKKTQSSTVTRQNVTIHNNTTNITNNTVPANIGGPIQGRPLQFQQPQQAGGDAGGMAKFKNWINKTFEKQEETRRQRDREYQRREINLTKSANKMMRKLEDFSKDITKKLDPRNVGKTVSGQLNGILRILGIGIIAKNFTKILDWIFNAEKKVKNEYIPDIKNFFAWVKGDKENAQTPGFITKISDALKDGLTSVFVGKDSSSDAAKEFREKGLLGGLGVILRERFHEFSKGMKEEISHRWELVRSLPKPESFETKDILRYIADMIGVMVGGEGSFQSVVQNRIESKANDVRTQYYLDKGHEAFEEGGYRMKNQSQYATGPDGKPIKVSSGVSAYLSGNYKYLGAHELDRGHLRTTGVPERDASGNFVYDKDGNIALKEKTTFSARIGQSTEVGTLYEEARRGKGNDGMMLQALRRMSEAVEKDGDFDIAWDTLVLLIGAKKAEEKFGKKKVTYRKIVRPKTIQELTAGVKVRENDTFEGLLTRVADKKLGIRKAKSYLSLIGIDPDTGKSMNVVQALTTGPLTNWAWYRIKSSPEVYGAYKLLQDINLENGIDPFVDDYIPLTEQDPEGKTALEVFKLIYGDDCFLPFDNRRWTIVTITEDEWKYIQREAFGQEMDFQNNYGGAANTIMEKFAELNSKNVAQSTLKDQLVDINGNPILRTPGEYRPEAVDEKYMGSVVDLNSARQAEAAAAARRQAAWDNNARTFEETYGKYSWTDYGDENLPYPARTMSPGERYAITEARARNHGDMVSMAEDDPMRQVYAENQAKREAEKARKEAQKTNWAASVQDSLNNAISGAVPDYTPSPVLPGAEPVDDSGLWVVPTSVASAEDAKESMDEVTGTNEAVSDTGEVFDIKKAVDHLTAIAAPDSTGNCAKHVRMAMQAGGLNVDDRPGYGGGYADYLPRKGWKLIPNNTAPLPGDVLVTLPFKNKSLHKSGHIAMWNGRNWISDFVQQSRDVYGKSGGTPENMFKMFRFGNAEAVVDPNYQTSTAVGSLYNRSNFDFGYQDIDGTWKKPTFSEFLEGAKETVKNAIGAAVIRTRTAANGAKEILVRQADGSLKWEAANHGGYINYDSAGNKIRTSFEEGIYNRYTGADSLTTPTVINGKKRNEWWAGYFDEKGNLKMGKDEKDKLNPELKKALDGIEVELKKGNGMDELQLKFAADSLDGAMRANAGQNAREQRLINALVERNSTTNAQQLSGSTTNGVVG